ncbi:hypothetical protein [Shouchella tritolerans]|uniref:hypothetical protein n=1 Tax=Shouchella tritolerans TaxID=2979466 RepID=UPI0021E7F7F2|nr:hypothetical protein [Shouchella tritolerans]
MWIVVREWSDREVEVNEFEKREEAEYFFEEWLALGTAKMYLAKVEKVKEERNG